MRARVTCRLLLVAAVVATGGAATTYTVRKGDTVGAIAARNKTTVAAIAAANHLADPSKIRIGQTLIIPDGADTSKEAGGAAAAGGYVVRSGDTLASVAKRYGTTPAALAAANGITDGRLYVGARLRIVGPNAAPTASPLAGGAAASAPATYVVRSGDTLASVAKRFKTTVAAIAAANGIKNVNRVYARQTLTIPGGAAAPAWRCPVAGAKFINDWGFPRSGGRFHEGNDLFAPMGAPAVATVNGVVDRRQGSLAGNEARLHGDDGFIYIYTHFSKYGAAGRVGAGAVIGYVGNTGSAAGGPAHLHFEIHKGTGPAINPYPTLIAGRCKG